MKKFKYLALTIGLTLCSQGLVEGFSDKSDSLESLKLIEKKSHYRTTLALGLLAIIGYINHQKFISVYKEHPIPSLILSYITGTIIIDMYIQYKAINKNILLLKATHKTYLYIKSALLIEPDTEKCFKLIEKYSSFSIDEIEKITQTTIFNSLKCLNCTLTTHISCECPTMHELNSIDLHEIIAEIKDDPEIYQILLSLERKNFIDKEKTFEKIGKKIDANIKFLIANKNSK